MTKILEADLKQMADHINYEAWMLEQSFVIMKSGQLNSFSSPIRNAMLESFGIHARNLISFLYSGTKKQEDDVIAEDYLVTNDLYFSVRLPKSDVEKNVSFRVGKEIAHLTYHRNTLIEETKKWDITEIHKIVFDALSKFFNALPESRKGYFSYL